MRILMLLFMAISINGFSQQLDIVKHGKSNYVLVVEKADPISTQAAEVLKTYLHRATGCHIPIVQSRQVGVKHIVIEASLRRNAEESYHIQRKGEDLYFHGQGRGVLFGVYRFIEDRIGARKWYMGAENTFVPKLDDVSVPAGYKLQSAPAFLFREVYFPVEADPEYLDWHGLHNLENLWGLWGHTFDQLLPAKEYFGYHPEYFAFFQGKRRPNQLCLSSPEVLHLVKDKLRQLIQANPTAKYWSISPNDDIGHCQCDRCTQTDKEEGGPQGSLIKFVNSIAKDFPENNFTTLAYTYSANPPLHLKTEPNVYVMLSTIDSKRSLPIAQDPSSATFRSQLKRWNDRTDHLFIWDYYTQFTNYLAPFAQWGTLQKNLLYYHEQGVQGVFAQGSGATYSDMAELKAYLLAKLLWDPSLDETRLTNEFVTGYYGSASTFVLQYMQAMTKNIREQQVSLDIYANPIDNRADYLSPKCMDSYSSILDKAEAAVEGDSLRTDRIRRLRMSLEYVFLQQARTYGLQRHGIFQLQADGSWHARPLVLEKISRFAEHAASSGVTEVAESNGELKSYLQEWKAILDAGVRKNKATEGNIKLTFPFVEDYPANRESTLNDGTPGYLDYSYNWLLFNKNICEATLSFDKPVVVKKIEVTFLQDARHWIFSPKKVKIYVSEDGKTFHEKFIRELESPSEDYSRERVGFSVDIDEEHVKAIKVYGEPFGELPEWRYHKSKTPSIAIDEIWVD